MSRSSGHCMVMAARRRQFGRVLRGAINGVVRGLNRFRHYVNLRRTARKLERLLDDFSFGPARDVLNAYDLVVVPR